MLTLLKRAFKDFNDDECPVRAAALAYYTVFALPPLLVLLLMLAGTIWDPRDVQRAMEGQFASLVGNDGATAIHGMIQGAERAESKGALAATLGFGALLFGATGAFLQLQSALNRAWEVRPDPRQGGFRSFVGKRLLSLGMILGVAFLMIVSLALSALVGALGDSLTFLPEPVLHAVNFTLSFSVMTLLFAAIFRILPDAEIEWRDVWVGAVVTSALFVAGKFAIGLYLGRSSPGDAFGAASALAVILVWVYYAGMIVLFGAEFTQAWAHKRGADIRPEKGAIRVDRYDARSRRARLARTDENDIARDDAHDVRNITFARSLQMESIESHDLRRTRTPGANGRPVPAIEQEPSIGELFRQLSTDSSHLVRQELNLAKTELRETGSHLGQAAARMGAAVAVALPGLLALTAFLVIGLGDLIDNYWASALIVGVALLGIGAFMAKRAIATMKEGGIGIPKTAGTLREDAQWAKEEAGAFKRQFTA